VIRRIRAVYVSPNGIGTALVRSQVLPYLRALEAAGVDTTLVTFERDEPAPPGELPRVRHVPLRRQRGTHLLAKVADVIVGTLAVIASGRRAHADIIHARSYLPAAIAWIASAVLRRPYIFDMRGFLGDEYVEAGYWSARDLRYRAVRTIERHLIGGAAAIVVLTRRGEERLRTTARYGTLDDADITVIPCGVDLARFRPADERSPVPTLVYSGSLGMWYLLPEMLRVYAHAREREPRLRLLIVNRTEHALIQEELTRARLDGADVRVVAADFSDMPSVLAQAHVGIALIRRQPSKLGSSPIKVAEYLACGLPVVVNAGMGDTDDLIDRSGAGHVVRSFDEPELRRAGDAVVALVGDIDARIRARELAAAEFDVVEGGRRYVALYERIARGVRR